MNWKQTARSDVRVLPFARGWQLHGEASKLFLSRPTRRHDRAAARCFSRISAQRREAHFVGAGTRQAHASELDTTLAGAHAIDCHSGRASQVRLSSTLGPFSVLLETLPNYTVSRLADRRDEARQAPQSAALTALMHSRARRGPPPIIARMRMIRKALLFHQSRASSRARAPGNSADCSRDSRLSALARATLGTRSATRLPVASLAGTPPRMLMSEKRARGRYWRA